MIARNKPKSFGKRGKRTLFPEGFARTRPWLCGFRGGCWWVWVSGCQYLCCRGFLGWFGRRGGLDGQLRTWSRGLSERVLIFWSLWKGWKDRQGGQNFFSRGDILRCISARVLERVGYHCCCCRYHQRCLDSGRVQVGTLPFFAFLISIAALFCLISCLRI